MKENKLSGVECILHIFLLAAMIVIGAVFASLGIEGFKSNDYLQGVIIVVMEAVIFLDLIIISRDLWHSWRWNS